MSCTQAAAMRVVVQPPPASGVEKPKPGRLQEYRPAGRRPAAGLGYPIATVHGTEGGYQLEAGATLPPLMFDADEAVATLLARLRRTRRERLPYRRRHGVTVGVTGA
jgi:hypothetical protein